MIERHLDELNKKGKLLLIMKANQGYSAVVVDAIEEYSRRGARFLMKYHHNGETVEEAIRSAAANPEKSD